jgi:spermidine dehydrogenase
LLTSVSASIIASEVTCPTPFTRRDFLNATLLASGAVLAEGASPLQLLAARGEAGSFDGPGGIGDYAGAHGDLWAEMVEGHRIRDRSYERVRPRDVAEAGTFDCVVIGGGISGLAAALFFARKAGPGRTRS